MTGATPPRATRSLPGYNIQQDDKKIAKTTVSSNFCSVAASPHFFRPRKHNPVCSVLILDAYILLSCIFCCCFCPPSLASFTFSACAANRITLAALPHYWTKRKAGSLCDPRRSLKPYKMRHFHRTVYYVLRLLHCPLTPCPLPGMTPTASSACCYSADPTANT